MPRAQAQQNKENAAPPMAGAKVGKANSTVGGKAGGHAAIKKKALAQSSSTADHENMPPPPPVDDLKKPAAAKWSSNFAKPTASSLNRVVKKTSAATAGGMATRSKSNSQLNKSKQSSTASSETGKKTKDTATTSRRLELRSFSYMDLKEIEDIDAGDADKPQMCSRFANSIYDYIRAVEIKQSVQEDFLQDMQDVTPRMRGILVDWLVQVHQRFRLLQETLYLTVSLLDRYLQLMPVSRRKLQLVGVTSMFIASKYEEMYAPEIADFVYITDGAFTVREILAMELVMLRALDFQMGRPFPLHFLRRNSKASYADGDRHMLTKFLCEVMLPEYECAHWAPSYQAGVATCLAMQLLDPDSYQWDDTTAWYSYYTEAELMPGVRALASIVLGIDRNKNNKAVAAKYKGQKYLSVSTWPCLKGDKIKELASEPEAS